MQELSLDDQVAVLVAKTAELRAATVEAAHFSTTYTPVDVAQALQDINSQLKEVLAIARNNRILARNRHNAVLQDYQPLYKTIPGNGVDLATQIYGNVQNLQHLLIPPAQEPIVGTLPPNFSDNYLAYQRADFVSLIIFYNEDFGIVEVDTVPDCLSKFLRFLTTY